VFNRRLLGLARPAWFDLTLTITAGLLGGAVLVGQAFYLSRIISRVFLQGDTLAGVAPLVWGLLGLSLGRAGLTWAGHLTAQRLAGQVKLALRDRLAAHLLALGPAYTRGQRTGELTAAATAGIEALHAYFSHYLPQLALAALVPLTILAFVLPLDLLTGLVLLFTAPLIPLFMWLIGSTAEQLTRRQWTALSRMSAHFLDVLQGLTTLKLLGRSREQVDLIAGITRRFGDTTLSVLRVAFLSALVLELVATLGTAVVAVEIGLRLLSGRLAFEQALFVLVLAPDFYQPLRLLGTRFHAGMAGAAAAGSIFEILDAPLPIAPPPLREASLWGRPPTHHPAAIHFDTVAYTYAGDNRPALYGVSFVVEPGQRVALVGPSGAGKSTAAHLLLGFIRPTAGEITVGNVPLGQLDPRRWRDLLAWVPQQPYLFQETVAQNIGLARPGASLDAVRQAAQLAHAEEFIEALPQGYNTPIGEQGARLSGGQAQRLALARAFLKDAPYLVLDEATANLDPLHQNRIQAAITRLMQGRTVLMIAHRLVTVQTADTILVFDRGHILDRGSHTELVNRPGLYRNMVKG
jgi:ATP-binding cassette subfamily C protein CydD